MIGLSIICLLRMIGWTIVAFILRRLFRTYRYKLELYQHLLVDFIPDRSGEKFIDNLPPNLSILPEENEEYYDTEDTVSEKGGRGFIRRR